jgi:hypothetical protein
MMTVLIQQTRWMTTVVMIQVFQAPANSCQANPAGTDTEVGGRTRRGALITSRLILTGAVKEGHAGEEESH